jgi:hypothetical protein
MINKQTYFNAFNQDIEMVRGDTLCFNFQLAGLGSRADYEDLGVLFSVAEHYADTPVVTSDTTDGVTLEDYNAESDTATFSVCVIPAKTKNLDLIRYYYDLQISDTANVITLQRGKLTLVWDVAD